MHGRTACHIWSNCAILLLVLSMRTWQSVNRREPHRPPTTTTTSRCTDVMQLPANRKFVATLLQIACISAVTWWHERKSARRALIRISFLSFAIFSGNKRTHATHAMEYDHLIKTRIHRKRNMQS